MASASALRAGRASPTSPRRFLLLITARGWVDLRAIVQLKGFGKLKKNSMLSRPATFRLVAQWLDQLRYPVPFSKIKYRSYMECKDIGVYGVSMCGRKISKCYLSNYVTLKAVKIDNELRAFRLESKKLSKVIETCSKERSYLLNQTSLKYILYFSILLHSFNTEYLLFCPSINLHMKMAVWGRNMSTINRK
jgi:hypothetical protein